jgi:hypothetical protein
VGLAVGEAIQDREAMGESLVSGQTEPTLEAARWLDEDAQAPGC